MARTHHKQGGGGGIVSLSVIVIFVLFVMSCVNSSPTDNSVSTEDVNDEYRRMEARQAQQEWNDRQDNYMRAIQTEIDRKDRRF